MVTGDETWRFYELKVQMTMVKGGWAQLWFNIHDNEDLHFAPLLGWQTAAIMAPDHTKLDVVNHVSSATTSMTSFSPSCGNSRTGRFRRPGREDRSASTPIATT